VVSTYTVLLAVHLLAAVVWVGSNVALDLQAARALATDDPARTSGFLSDAAFLGGRVFAPAAGILLLAGFGLMVEVDYDFDFWIIFALAVWLLSFFLGIFYFGPESSKLSEMVVADAPPPEVGARLTRLAKISRVETILLLLVVIDMAIKPGL